MRTAFVGRARKTWRIHSRLNEVITPPLPHTGVFQEIATTMKTALTSEMQRSQARLDQVRHGSLVHETIGHMLGLLAYCGSLSELVDQSCSNLSTNIDLVGYQEFLPCNAHESMRNFSRAQHAADVSKRGSRVAYYLSRGRGEGIPVFLLWPMIILMTDAIYSTSNLATQERRWMEAILQKERKQHEDEMAALKEQMDTLYQEVKEAETKWRRAEAAVGSACVHACNFDKANDKRTGEHQRAGRIAHLKKSNKDARQPHSRTIAAWHGCCSCLHSIVQRFCSGQFSHFPRQETQHMYHVKYNRNGLVNQI